MNYISKYILKSLTNFKVMLTKDDQIHQSKLFSNCKGGKKFINLTILVEKIFGHNICMKCIIADYPQENYEVNC